MAIPDKGSRSVVVGDSCFRWYVRRKPTYSQAAMGTAMTVAIERVDDHPGRVLLVNLAVSRPDNWRRPHQTALTPRMVREIIAEAVAAGWDPGTHGSAFEFDYGLIADRP